MRIFFLFIMLFLSFSALTAGGGVQYQAYPAGQIYTLAYSYRPAQSQSMYEWYLSYNVPRRQDFGEHQNEEGEGGGPGFSWRYYLFSENRLFLGLRGDWWWLRIDWEDERDGSLETGTTRISVFQPTAIFGLTLEHNVLSFDIYGALGFEWNVITDGEEVGQGPIGLIGLALRF